jgi:hypothetical protein
MPNRVTTMKRWCVLLLVGSTVLVAACGGGGGDKDQARTSTATPPLPTETWVSGGATTARPWHTVTPSPASVADRHDCPDTWVVYVDPKDRFSICYAHSFSASASEFAVNIVSPGDRATRTLDGVTVIVGWDPTSGTIYSPPNAENCSQLTGVVVGPSTSTFLQVALRGTTAPACLTVGRISSSAYGWIPLARDGSDRIGFIQYSVDYIAPDMREIPTLGRLILSTLDVKFR